MIELLPEERVNRAWNKVWKTQGDNTLSMKIPKGFIKYIKIIYKRD